MWLIKYAGKYMMKGLWVRERRWNLALLGLIAVLALSAISAQRNPVWEFNVPTRTVSESDAVFKTILDIRSRGNTMHSPAIILGSVPSIIWFEGSAEAAKDVAIMSVDLLDPGYGVGQAEPLLTAKKLTNAMSPRQSVLVLGNTIQGSVGRSGHLLATILSVGGWAASSIADVRLEDGKVAAARKLSLSPFLNRSHLVRNSVLGFSDGDVGVPAYFEMGNAFGELIRVTPQGRVLAKSRIGRGKIAIQPEIVVTGKKTAVALMRDFDGKKKLVRSFTNDGGKSWSRPTYLENIPNPDSPVSAISLSDGRILMVFNDSEISAGGLSMAVSQDEGLSWNRLGRIGGKSAEIGQVNRYPDMEMLDDGTILLTYSSHGKKGIRAHIFNEAWVRSLE